MGVLQRWAYDAAVIGAGPAGLTSAICLARSGARVALFDVQPTARSAERTETLRGTAGTMLARIEATGALQACDAVFVPAFASRWSGALSERPGILDPHGPAFHVDRSAFRAALTRVAIDAGVHPFLGSRAHALLARGRWRIDSGMSSVQAPFLVVASGRSSLPIDARVRRRSVDRLVAVLGSAQSNATEEDFDLTIEAAASGWWYRCPSTPTKQQIVFLSDVDLVTGEARSAEDWFAQSLRRTALGKVRLTDEPIRMTAANTYWRDAVVGDNIVLVGDAAVAGDPLAGQGVLWAIESGIRAADVASRTGTHRHAALASYSHWLATRFGTFLQTRTSIYRQVTRWSNGPFWKRRQEVALQAC